MSPRKVLHILHAFSHGGLENGIVNIINGSPADLEHELCLLTTAGEFIQRLKKPVRYYELHKRPGNSVKTIIQLHTIIRESCADIVHTRNWGAFDGVLASCLCPGVVLLHGEHGRDITDPKGLNRRRNFMRRMLSARVRKFTTVSQDLKQWLCNKVQIPEDKVALIRNGVDTDRFRPHRDPELRRSLGIGNNEFVIGTVGRLDPVKNHAELIQAFAAFAREQRSARLLIVGDGPEKRNLENLIRELGLDPGAVLLGYKDNAERFYGVFDVFVLNSIAEGMSNTLLEAMSSGLPIICTAAGANPELVADGKSGLLIPVGENRALTNAIKYYSNSPEARLNHGEAGRRFILESFSLKSMIQNYVGLYLGS